ncbi:hypothetical protein GCM10023176_39270 [Micromonospora coerulea]|uniref:Uncharacterized protein n=1 Tax=Micromonospora coerulea TaxID=47856 RepID=A0ABP8SQB9_9ACTN
MAFQSCGPASAWVPPLDEESELPCAAPAGAPATGTGEATWETVTHGTATAIAKETAPTSAFVVNMLPSSG